MSMDYLAPEKKLTVSLISEFLSVDSVIFSSPATQCSDRNGNHLTDELS